MHTLTFAAPLAGGSPLATRDGVRDHHVQRGDGDVGPLRHIRRGLLPRDGWPLVPLATRLALLGHAPVPHRRDAVRARGGAQARRTLGWTRSQRPRAPRAHARRDVALNRAGSWRLHIHFAHRKQRPPPVSAGLDRLNDLLTAFRHVRVRIFVLPVKKTRRR